MWRLIVQTVVRDVWLCVPCARVALLFLFAADDYVHVCAWPPPSPPFQFPDLLFCGWAPSNTAFRSTVCWLVIVAGMAVIAGYRCDSSRTLFWCRNAFLVATVAMISVLTLDSNSVRVGASYCADSLPLPAGMSKKCNSLSLIGLCAADGGAAIVLWITYEVVKATHKVLRDRPARRGTQLPPEAELTTP